MAVSLLWTVTVTNTSDTAATVKVVLKAKSTSGSWNGNSRSGYITIDGTKYTFSHSFAANTTTTLATKSKSISRTTSSKSVSIKASYSTGVSSGTVTKSGSTTVAARPTYTVTFNANGGTGGKSVSVYSGYTTTFPTTSRTGYTFGSWNGYAQGAATPAITSSRTYTASWTAINYSITYTLNSGTISGQRTSYTVATAAFTLPIPTRAGYYFTGWTGSNGSTPQRSVTIPAGSTGNRSYTANWRLNVYTLILNPNGGTVSPTSKTKTHGQTTSLPIPTYTGHIFAGWQNNAGTNLGLNTCPANINGTNDGDTIQLTAIWSNAVRPVIYHYYNSATEENNTYQVYKIKDTPINTLLTPEIPNYILNDWYLNSDYTGNPITSISNDYDFPEGDPRYENPDANAIHLYGKWTPTYTIIFNSNSPSYNDGIEAVGNVEPIVVISGITTTIPLASNYTYTKDEEVKMTAINWNSNIDGSGQTYTNSITLTNLEAGASYNLYAQWTPQQFTQTFTRGEATSGNNYTITANYYSTINLPNKPNDWVYSQHTFSQWQLQKDESSHQINESFLITESNTFIGQWNSNYTLPQINITAERFLDEDGETPSESGKYIKIILSGQNGAYIGVNNPNYTYLIQGKFFDEEGAEIETIQEKYTSVDQSVNQIKFFSDKKLTYSSCEIIFKDTTDYNGLLPLEDSNRIYTYSFQIPLTRGVAIHIADDLSAMSILGELEEQDRGLVIKGNTFFNKTATFNQQSIFNELTIFNKLVTFNDVVTVGPNGTINVNDVININNAQSNHMISINGNQSSISVMYEANRTDTGISVKFGVGSGGINHGVWSDNLNKWIIYSDGTNVYANGTNSSNSSNLSALVHYSTYSTDALKNVTLWSNTTNRIALRVTTGAGNGNGEDKQYTLYAKDDCLQLYNATTQADVWRLYKSADYVIEQGTKSGTASGPFSATATWKYRIWNSGRREAWCSVGGSCAPSISDGGGYRTAWLSVSIPSGIFTATPQVNCNVFVAAESSSITAPVGSGGTSTTSTGRWAGLRVTQVSSATWHGFNFYCVQ